MNSRRNMFGISDDCSSYVYRAHFCTDESVPVIKIIEVETIDDNEDGITYKRLIHSVLSKFTFPEESIPETPQDRRRLAGKLTKKLGWSTYRNTWIYLPKHRAMVESLTINNVEDRFSSRDDLVLAVRVAAREPHIHVTPDAVDRARNHLTKPQCYDPNVVVDEIRKSLHHAVA